MTKNEMYCIKIKCGWTCTNLIHKLWFWFLAIFLFPVWFWAVILKLLMKNSEK